MRDIKQIREQNTITEKEDSEAKKLTTLIRAGLFDTKKLPMLKRALQKDSTKLTPQERGALIDLLDSLMDQVLHSQQVFSKVKQNVSHKEINEAAITDYMPKNDPLAKQRDENIDKQIPPVVTMRRKAVRNFMSGQRVALYYAPLLDKYITIPFEMGGESKGSGPAVVKEETINELSDELKDRTIQGRIQQASDALQQGDRAGATKATIKARAAYDRNKRLQANSGYNLDKMNAAHNARMVYANKKDDDLTPEEASHRAKANFIYKQQMDRFTKKRGDLEGNALAAKHRQEITQVKNAAKDAANKTPFFKKPDSEFYTAPLSGGWEGVGELAGRAAVGAVHAPLALASAGIKALRGKPKPTLPPLKESKLSNNFRAKLQEKRQLDEVSASDVAQGVDTAADYFVPLYSASKNFAKGDYGAAAKDVAIDAVAAGLGAVTGGLGYVGVKGLQAGLRGATRAGVRAAERGAVETGARAAERGAVETGTRAAERGALETGTRAGTRTGTRAGTRAGLRAGLRGALSDTGDSSSSSDSSSQKQDTIHTSKTAGGSITGNKGPNLQGGLTSPAQQAKMNKAMMGEDFTATTGSLPLNMSTVDRVHALVQRSKDAASRFSKSAGANTSSPTNVVSQGNLSSPVLQKKLTAAYMGGTINENKFDSIRSMVKNKISEQEIVFNEETININNNVAEKILEVHKSLNKNNRSLYESMINESVDSFKKAVNFALRY